jgi:hypothetical protein
MSNIRSAISTCLLSIFQTLTFYHHFSVPRRRSIPMKTILISLLFLLLSTGATAANGAGRIVHDTRGKAITLSDSTGKLVMRVSYQDPCAVDRIVVMGRDLLTGHAGIRSMLKPVSSYPAPSPVPPTVSVTDRKVIITGIRLDAGVTETWTFEPLAGGVDWRIDQTCPSPVPVEFSWSPEWVFPSMSTWTAALLGDGGVAWFALFDSSRATYGVHTSEVLLWKKGEQAALRIAATSPSGDAVAARFTRQENRELSLGFSVSPKELLPKYDEGLHRRRYLPAREDVWSPFVIPQRTVTIEYHIQAVDFHNDLDPGTMPPFDARTIQMIANTVARVGVIDSRLHGGNSWRTPYGPICLHEQYIAQLGLIMQDTNYFNDYARTLDYYRDHAILPDGRVKSRWAYTCEDAMPGTCDSLGFYEAQWGYLLDSNPDFVTNVAELFDFTDDRTWLQGQKTACENALDYLLRRDSNGNGLVEMMTDDHRAARGSDWIDVIWASYENAFVNAKLYYALTLWSDLEQLLGDRVRAESYRAKASLLKASFNRSTDQGGLWSPSHKWYVHWRDRDNSIHGDNLVTFVNFMAIAYGICDDQERVRAILTSIEEEMCRENLFFWPICMFSYQPGEGLSWQFPFPSYENGDIFLSLGELGVRAYKDFDPAIPVKYITMLIARYEKDGLAFQRYLRKTQEGAGDDILAGNAFPVVGLYRDIYGIQPKYNRLYVEPHITVEMTGTAVNYRLRGRRFQIRPDLSGGASVTTSGVTCSDLHPFGIDCGCDTIRYFHGMRATPSMSVKILEGKEVRIAMQEWEEATRRLWSEQSPTDIALPHVIADLTPMTTYTVLVDGQLLSRGASDASGSYHFTYTLSAGKVHIIEVKPGP